MQQQDLDCNLKSSVRKKQELYNVYNTCYSSFIREVQPDKTCCGCQCHDPLLVPRPPLCLSMRRKKGQVAVTFLRSTRNIWFKTTCQSISISDLHQNELSFNICCQHSLVHHYITSHVRWEFLCGPYPDAKELKMLNCNSAGLHAISKGFVVTQVLTKLVWELLIFPTLTKS